MKSSVSVIAGHVNRIAQHNWRWSNAEIRKDRVGIVDSHRAAVDVRTEAMVINTYGYEVIVRWRPRRRIVHISMIECEVSCSGWILNCLRVSVAPIDCHRKGVAGIPVNNLAGQRCHIALCDWRRDSDIIQDRYRVRGSACGLKI